MGKGQPSTPTHMTPKRETIVQVYERLRPRVDGKAVTQSNIKALGSQLAGVRITGDQAAKGSSGSNASASISIGNVVLDEDQIEEFGTSIAFAQAVLKTVNLGDSEDLDEAREMLTELSNKKDALSVFKKKNPRFERYQVVSFSKLTTKHLADMGVTAKGLSQDRLNRVLQAFNDFGLQSKKSSRKKLEAVSPRFERFWLELTKDGRYINDFRTLKKNIGTKPEARARMLTDYILTQLMVFVDTHLDLIQFMFLELVLSSSSHPVPVEHENSATLLTGTVDYAILSAREDLGTNPLVDLRRVEDMIRELRGNTLDHIKDSAVWPVLQRFKHFKFTIIEEKRKDLGTKKLEDCGPQVVGESLALRWKTQQEHVMWCLSNGEEWIFGALNSTKQSRSLPKISIDDNDLEGSINKVLKMLILWTVCPVDNFRLALDM